MRSRGVSSRVADGPITHPGVPLEALTASLEQSNLTDHRACERLFSRFFLPFSWAVASGPAVLVLFTAIVSLWERKKS